jgi:hypothetical protein
MQIYIDTIVDWIWKRKRSRFHFTYDLLLVRKIVNREELQSMIDEAKKAA